MWDTKVIQYVHDHTSIFKNLRFINDTSIKFSYKAIGSQQASAFMRLKMSSMNFDFILSLSYITMHLSSILTKSSICA